MKLRIIGAVTLLAIVATTLVLLSLGHQTEQIDSYASCAQAGYPIAESDPPTCRANGHVFVGPITSHSPSTAPAASQDFQILVEGDSGGSYPQRQEVISNDAQWQAYWRTVHASLRSLPPILPVDFTADDVVALSEGQKMTGGYALKITSITNGPAGSTVYVTESVPTITCNVTQSISNRYFIARTAKLTEPINFRISTEYHRC